jgi:hypothetical protein
MKRRSVAVPIVAAILVACAEDKPTSGNGVDDVHKACEIRAGFNRNGNDCGVCEAAVVAPRCDCSSLKDFSAACAAQADARKPVCSDAIDTCVSNCKATDCDCIEGCYANDPQCKSASAARDGCIAEACASHCK